MSVIPLRPHWLALLAFVAFIALMASAGALNLPDAEDAEAQARPTATLFAIQIPPQVPGIDYSTAGTIDSTSGVADTLPPIGTPTARIASAGGPTAIGDLGPGSATTSSLGGGESAVSSVGGSNE